MHTSAKRADVAKKAGVSEATVSRALSDSPAITAPVKERVRAAAQELGYVPSRQAACFAQSKTLHIGLVVPYYRVFPPFSRPYFPTLLDGVMLGAQQRGYFVTLILDREARTGADIIDMVQSRVIDGLLLSISTSHDERIPRLQQHAVPFVLINNYEPGCFSVDGRPDTGMRAAFEHAASNGHTSVGYVTGDLNYKNATDRLRVFNELAVELGMRSHAAKGNFSRMSGYRCAGSLLQCDDPPTLIMTAADRQAIGVLDYCREHRIAVPGEISVIGYDNFDPAADMTPPLTTVDNPVAGMGRVAAHLLVDILEGKILEPAAEWLDTGFVVRQSSGRKAA